MANDAANAASPDKQVAAAPQTVRRGVRVSALELMSAARRFFSTSQIGAQLAGVVLLTGTLTFGVIGLFAELSLRDAAAEQAAVLEQISRERVARKLDGEARLAAARLDFLFDEANRQARYLSQRLDLVKTVASSNNVALQEILAPAAVTSELDALLVIDSNGTVRGASEASDLLAATDALATLGLQDVIRSLYSDNQRSVRRAHRSMFRLSEPVATALGLPSGRRPVHVSIEPVFDDFGDVAGELVGLRTLAPSEPIFEAFAALVHAGVAIFDGTELVTSGGVKSPGLMPAVGLAERDLILTPDGMRAARCIAHHSYLVVCAHTDIDEVRATQDEMVRISTRQSRALIGWFLVISAASLALLVAVVLVAVRRVTRGLPELASAAGAVAGGNLDIPFRASGIGEVKSLGHAFEVMLQNLRKSLGRTQQLAFFDPVTGLANRQKMRLDGIIALREVDRSVAFLFIDLDRFKSINDTFGHKAGDALLRLLAVRLTGFFQRLQQSGKIDEHFVGRLGGDEFLVIICGDVSEKRLTVIAEALIALLSEPYAIGRTNMSVGASIGIALPYAGSPNYDDLLINADIAMYEAKRQGRNSFAMFTADAAARVQERLALEQELGVALRERQLRVHYQPKISLVDGSVKGVEALVRWPHPLRGNVPPGKFIGIAEEAGLIQPLGLFVLEEALAEIGPIIAAGLDITVSINVSALQLEDPAFARMVAECLAAASFPAHHLELEITETVAMGTSELVHGQLAALRTSGVRFSVDDFGTGYSNLSNLARLRVETLKIDQSLVQGVSGNLEQQKIVRSILSLARSLALETVVEGIETEADFAFVVAEGADVGQGYYFSPAVPIEELTTLLRPGRLRLQARIPVEAARQRSA